MLNKRAGLMHRIMIQIIIVAIVFGLFLFANAQKINARGLRQEMIEKQTALLIDSAVSGMSFEILKMNNLYGSVEAVSLDKGKVFISVNGLPSQKGYPYFSRYQVIVEEEATKFIIKVL
jgi:hypothetical protein